MIHLTFYGAMAEVGASGMMLEKGTDRIVMDYGASTEETPARPPLPIDKHVNSVLLSHAHVDHCGSLPTLTRKFNPPIYAAPCTKEITEMLLYDSLKINMQEIGNVPGMKLPFDRDDIKNTMHNFKVVPYRKPFKVPGATVTYFDGGHIPGSAMCHVNFGGKSFMYNGNLNDVDSRLLKGCDMDLPKTDVLITESTYSDRDHPSRESQEKELIKLVTQTISNDGIALIPSFAVGRAQEILLILEQEGIDYPVYMDGMAKKATTMINRHKELLREPSELDDTLKKVKFVTTPKHRSKVVRNPCAIITTSGMLDGGPTNSYMRKIAGDRRSTLILTGYQAQDTAGKRLLETGRFINNEEGINLEVRMRVKRLDFSAHIGKKGLYKFIEKMNPQEIFCVHGEQTEDFARELKENGFNGVAPIANNRFFKFSD